MFEFFFNNKCGLVDFRKGSNSTVADLFRQIWVAGPAECLFRSAVCLPVIDLLINWKSEGGSLFDNDGIHAVKSETWDPTISLWYFDGTNQNKNTYIAKKYRLAK